uniref:Homeobox domain-containing protein n=1 Tax=Araucaria cunninghamii TaxID=56994 RepID=A0A0D6R4J4_ARACU
MESEEDKISPENKKRRLKTPFQVEGLENFYAEHKYPSEAMKTQLSLELGLSEKQVQGWFCHRRLKDKRLMKEEGFNNGKQDSHSGLIQASADEVKQDPSSNGKKADHHGYLMSKEAGNQQLTNAMDYPAAVLASELRDQDLFTGNRDNMEDTFGGSSSASQERSSLHSENPNEVEAIRYLSQNGSRHEMVAKRKKNTDFYRDRYIQENGEHTAISAVRKQLGEEYREDGPPLSVEFHPLPPGAFDAPIEPSPQVNTNAHDLLRMPNSTKGHEVGKVSGSQRFHATPAARPGYSSIPVGLKFEQASPKFERSSPNYEWTSHSKTESLNSKSSWRAINNHIQAGDSYHVPDLNSSMQMDEDSPGESPSSGFATKSFPSWHKQEKVGRANSETYMPLLYGSKNGTMAGKTGTVGKELPISQPYNSVKVYYNKSGINSNVNAAVQCRDLLSSQEDKVQSKKMTKRERLREERRALKEQEHALKMNQKLIQKEEKRSGREKQEENKRQREVAKFQTAAEKVSLLKNQTKGPAGEIPTSFSEDDAADSSSSME